jgi:hypothetical protein
MRYTTRFQLTRAGRQGAAQLGCDPSDWVRSREITNADTVPDVESDGEISGTLPPGMLVLHSMVSILRPPLPETMEARAANGHTMTYRVTGRDKETGRLTYSQWDADHSERCSCLASDGDYSPIPEW